MANDLETFAATLADDERNTLHASVTFVLDVVARADHDVDRKERNAIDQLRKLAGEKLGAAFAAPASDFPEATKAAAHFEWPMQPYLKNLGLVARKMPANVKESFGRTILELMLGVAGASGGFLSIGSKLSDHEKYAINRVIAALDLKVPEDLQKAMK